MKAAIAVRGRPLISVTFSSESTQRIERERYYNPHPGIRRMMNALWLKSCGLSHGDICRLAGISSTTLTNYLKRYNETSLDDLLEPAYHIPKSELEQHRDTLKEYFEAHPPRAMKEAAHKIEELTGIERSTQRVRVFLKGLGLSYRKVGMVPSKADPEIQEEFKKKRWSR
jgi:transposase